MRTPRGATLYSEGAHQGQRQQGLGASKILLYIAIILIAGMLLLNFLPAVGVSGCVGVIEVSGEITSSSVYGGISSTEVNSLLMQAEGRPDIRSVLVVIDSPGGSVVASDEIYSTLNKMGKPTVAYIGDTGASGGYYIALGADKIFANPASITGSVGVRSGTLYDLSRLLNSSGINATAIKSGAMKDMGEVYRPLTRNETAMMQSIIDEMAADFRELVLQSREGKNDRFSAASLDRIADARIITGKQAFALGLVDDLGTRRDALNYAAAAVGMEPDPSVCELKVQRDFLSSLFTSMGRGIGESLSSFVANQQLKVA
ncbi:Peptidase family S49 [uncultured archaeon]|nr:Peptidase family S49 [uncultured archaeon]